MQCWLITPLDCLQKTAFASAGGHRKGRSSIKGGQGQRTDHNESQSRKRNWGRREQIQVYGGLSFLTTFMSSHDFHRFMFFILLFLNRLIVQRYLYVSLDWPKSLLQVVILHSFLGGLNNWRGPNIEVYLQLHRIIGSCYRDEKEKELKEKRKEIDDLRRGEETEIHKARQAALDKVHNEVWAMGKSHLLAAFVQMDSVWRRLVRMANAVGLAR